MIYENLRHQAASHSPSAAHQDSVTKKKKGKIRQTVKHESFTVIFYSVEFDFYRRGFFVAGIVGDRYREISLAGLFGVEFDVVVTHHGLVVCH